MMIFPHKTADVKANSIYRCDTSALSPSLHPSLIPCAADTFALPGPPWAVTFLRLSPFISLRLLSGAGSLCGLPQQSIHIEPL